MPKTITALGTKKPINLLIIQLINHKIFLFYLLTEPSQVAMPPSSS